MNCCNVDINQLVTIWCHWSESPTIIKFLCDYGKADRGLHHEDSVNPTQTLINQRLVHASTASILVSYRPLAPKWT